MATGLRHDLYLGGAWVDVSGHVQAATPTMVTRGRSGDDTSTTGQCAFTLLDPDGRYWPGNPTGTYYGELGRNTPHRVSVDGTGASWVDVAGTNAAITTPYDAAFSVTDLDIRLDVDMRSWHTTCALAGRWAATNAQWVIYTLPTGRLAFGYSSNGTTLSWAYSTEVVPFETGRLAVRVTLDVDNGASGHTVTFYTGTTVDGSWTQFGDTTVTAGTTSLYASTRDVTIGDYSSRFDGRVHEFLWVASIGSATAVADPDFTGLDEGDTSLIDAAGNTWTITAPAAVVDRDYRWHGEIREWPHTQDPTGDYQTVSVVSRDIMGRRASSTTPIGSVYYRGCTSTTAPVADLIAYWPMEDSTGADGISSGITGGRRGLITGNPSLAAASDFACSDSLPSLGDGDAFSLPIGDHDLSAQYQVMALVTFPSTVSSTTRVLDVRTPGALARITVSVTSSGGIQVTGQDETGATIHTGSVFAFAVLGDSLRLTLSWYVSGANTVYTVSTLAPGASAGLTTGARTITGYIPGKPYGISVSPDKTLSGLVVGHVTVQRAITSVYGMYKLLSAYTGETAVERLTRIGEEEGIPIRIVGGHAAAMGPQRVGTLRDILDDCETADGGILSPDPDRMGLVYRTRSSMTGIDAAITLDRDTAELSEWEPVYDDQHTANRVELSRTAGGMVVVEDTTTAMSTQDPPDGVGLTPASATVNVADDTDLDDQAGWRLSLGTCPDPRMPSIPVELARTAFSAGRDATARAVTVGDRIDVTGIPVTQYWDDLSQLVVGVGENITRFVHSLDWRARPYDPWNVGRVGDAFVGSAVLTEATTGAEGGVTFAGSQTRSYPATQQAGDLDVRVWVTMDDWSPSSEEAITARYDNSGSLDERSWALVVTTIGRLQCYLSTDGATAYTYTSTTGPGFTDGTAHWVRFYYTAASGTTAFYTSTDGLTWTQLGTTVSGSAIGGLHDAAADFQLGARSGTNLTSDMHGTVHVIQIIDGTEESPVPTRDNVGADMSTSWTVQSGNLYIDPGGTFSYTNYKFEDCRVRVRTADAVTFTNCWFAGNSALTTEHGLLDCTHADVADVTATNCTFTPETPTAYMTGVLGHHFELYDCLITNTVDGCGVYNTDTGMGAAATGVIVDGCWIGDHAWFATAPGQPDGSHADGIQFQGGQGTIVRNTVLEAYNDTTVGDSPWGRVGDTEFRALSALMFTPNVGDITDTLIQNCYLSGGEIMVNITAAGNAGNDVASFIGCSTFDDSYYSVNWLYVTNGNVTESGTSHVTEYPTGSGGGYLAPTDPTEWVDGYDGSGTGSTAISSTTTTRTILASSATTTATSLSVTVSDTEGWTHADGDYQIAVGGETMTVTAVSGTAPSQTLTVTRSVNGVVKTHAAGAPVQIHPVSHVGIAP